MRVLTTLNSNPRQSLYFTTEDSSERVKLTFYFLPTQNNWYFDIESDSLTIYGQRLCCHPNLLCKYSNNIDWGMSVVTLDGLDPYQVTDFTDGYCYVSMLDADEVEAVGSLLNGETE